mmetsp:Transcript_16152/g.29384  ORF Transcript_16152/g.29384 Transcript_16152/m.29384 type:complete len:446 (-) Transcript_16152:264-1601(-)
MTDVSTATGRNYDHLSIRIPSEDAEDVLEHVNDETNGTHHASVLHLNSSGESPQNDTPVAAKMDETRIEASSSGLAKENESLRQQVHMMQVEIDRLREECEKKKKHHTSSDDGTSTPERTSNRVVAGGGTLDLLKSWIPGRETDYTTLSVESPSHLPIIPNKSLFHRHAHTEKSLELTNSEDPLKGRVMLSGIQLPTPRSPRSLKAKHSDLELEQLRPPSSSSSSIGEGTLFVTDESIALNRRNNEYDEDDSLESHSHHKDQDTASNDDFMRGLKDRAGWLIGLLALQSCSSFILARNEELLQEHIIIVNFLTMLVGAGGNAGNQASVGVIRGLAVGTLNSRTVKAFLKKEFYYGLALSALLGSAGCARALLFRTPLKETFAITSSLMSIVFISVTLGSLLPLGMKRVGIDPAHSSTSIQVIMDILGVSIVVRVSALVLGFHKTV